MGNPAGMLSRKFVCAIIITIMLIRWICCGPALAADAEEVAAARSTPQETGRVNTRDRQEKC